MARPRHPPKSPGPQSPAARAVEIASADGPLGLLRLGDITALVASSFAAGVDPESGVHVVRVVLAPALVLDHWMTVTDRTVSRTPDRYSHSSPTVSPSGERRQRGRAPPWGRMTLHNGIDVTGAGA